MNTLRHILVTTDFSDAAGQTVNWAAAIAEKQHAQLTILHILEPGVGGVWTMDALRDPTHHIVLDRVMRGLEATLCLTKGRHIWRTTTRMIVGEAIAVLDDLAKQTRVDMIVLPRANIDLRAS